MTKAPHISRLAMHMRLNYFNCCVSWIPSDVTVPGGLCDMIRNEIAISRAAFLRHVNRQQLTELEESLGYFQHPKQGLTMAGDFHVSYHRSKLHGKTVYFFKHSAIEYVFSNEA